MGSFHVCNRLIVLPNWRVSATCVMLAFCTSIINGFISSVLNIPQFKLADKCLSAHERMEFFFRPSCCDVIGCRAEKTFVSEVQAFVNRSYVKETGLELSPMTASYLWSGIVTQRQIGQFVGAVSAPSITFRYGRKGCVMINSVILLIGLLLEFASEPSGAWALLLVGRFILGFGCGVIAVIIPVLMTEIAPQQFTGALASLHGMALGFGSFIADLCGLPEVLGTRRKWHYGYLPMVVLQVFQLIVYGLFCPESPKDLFIRQNNAEKAAEAIKFYHSPSPEQLARTLQRYTLERHNTIPTQSSQIRRLLTTKRYRMSVLLGVCATMCYAFGAIEIVTGYSTELITRVGGLAYSQFAGRISLAVGLLRFLAVLPSIYMLERAGRRPLLLVSLWGCIITFVAFLAIYAIYGAGKGTPASLIDAMAAFMLFYALMFSIGCQTVGTFFPAELVPTQERAANQAFAVTLRFAFAFVIAFAFYPLQQATEWGCWLELIIPLLLVTAFMYKYMPETKNRSVNEILAELNHETNEGTTLLSTGSQSSYSAPNNEENDC